MRSIWKGHIRFSLVTIPIQLYSALESEADVSFKQLHKKDNGKIQYKKFCATCEEEVPFGDIVKGYEYSPDQFVVLTPEDLGKIKLQSNKAIDIEAFVDVDQVHPSRFETTYYIGPSGDIAIPTYSLFVAALQKTGKAAVGRIILREKEDVVLIAFQDDTLILYKLRYPEEIRSHHDVPGVKTEKPSADQLKLAETLIMSLAKSFDEIPFEDRYKDALMEIVEQKIEGKEVVSIEDPEKDAPVVDIMEALKKSIEEAKKLKKGA
jgi:DNA end-binding protein Ku